MFATKLVLILSLIQLGYIYGYMDVSENSRVSPKADDGPSTGHVQPIFSFMASWLVSKFFTPLSNTILHASNPHQNDNYKWFLSIEIPYSGGSPVIFL